MNWLDAGEAVFNGCGRDDSFFPPLNDRDAMRQWLGGFGAAWAACPEEAVVASSRNGDGMGGESVEEALVRTLETRPELLRALWDLGLGKIPRVLN